MQHLTIWVAGVLIGFAGLLALTLLWRMWQGEIDLRRVIAEPNGDASLSRLQFLIFTFVIALSVFLVVIGQSPPAFPSEIPAGILTLLGISGSSYLVSKSISFSNPAVVTRPALLITPSTTKAVHGGGGVEFIASATPMSPDGSIPPVTWSLEAPAIGSLMTLGPASVRYLPPQGVPDKPSVTVRAHAPGYESATAEITLE